MTEPINPEPEFDYNDDLDDECWRCGGEGWISGYEIASQNDYGLIDSHKSYMCPCCHGSGLAKHCTYW